MWPGDPADGGGEDGEDDVASNGVTAQSGSSSSPSSVLPAALSSHPLLRHFPARGLGAGGVQPTSSSSSSLLSSSFASPSLTAHTEAAEFDRFTDLRDESAMGAAAAAVASSSASPSSSSASAGIAQFDFRHGSMPAGVTVYGDAELQEQADKSTALLLQPGACVRLSLPFAPNGAIRATRVNDYSLTLDLKTAASSSPFGSDGLSLYSTRWDVNSASGGEGEVYVSRSGGVGTFGEYGPSTSWLRAGRWQRVVVTMGGAWNSRRLCTFVNARPCSVISKGVFASADGRFSLTPDSLTLFASSRAALMPGLLLRFVELRSSCLSKEQVMEQANANRVYSYWEKEEQQAAAARQASLSLAPLYRRAPPVFVHPAFLGQMGDAFLEGTGLDSGDVAPSIAVLSLLYSQLRQQAELIGPLLADDDWAAVDAVAEVLKEARELSRRFTLARKSPAALVAFMKLFRARLEAVKEGEAMLVSAGIDSHPIMLTVERTAPAAYRLTVTNTHPLAGLQYHLVSASRPPKLRYKTGLSFDSVPAARMLDQAWWLLVFKLSVLPSKHNRPDKLYDLLLPHLLQMPLDATLSQQGDDADWRSPQRASTAYFKCIADSCKYLLRRRGMRPSQCKLVTFMLRLQLLQMLDNDLQFVSGVSDSDRRVAQMACRQVAYHALKIHRAAAAGAGGRQLEQQAATASSSPLPSSLSTQQLEAIHERVTTIDALLLSLPSTDLTSAASPSPLHLELPAPPQSRSFPLCERLLRPDDVDGLAGLPVRLPAYAPVDVLQQPQRARDLEEALAAIRHCDRECTRIAVQGHCVKHQPQLIFACIAHTFTHIVPVPLPASDPQWAGSVWSAEMRYALQLDLLLLLQRIVEHFAASAFSLQPTRASDSVRVIVPAVLMAVADCVMRKTATDIPSEVCLNLAGHPLGLPPYAPSLGRFVEQSEAMLLHTPQLAVARTACIDYFTSLSVPDSNLIFCWERFLAPEQSTCSLLSQICDQLAFPTADIALYVSGEQHLLGKNYPEWFCYRDLSLYLKLFLNTELAAFPPVAVWTQRQAGLRWRYDEGVYLVQAFGQELTCKPRKAPFTLRFPSPAVASLLTAPHAAETEDDILHIKSLPSFDDSLGQRDAELLLSFLTVPYLRLPLTLAFFATEDRIHALRSEQLRDIVDSVVLEPGRYLAAGAAAVPTMVPCANAALLCSPYGHLLNELHRSPDSTLQSTLRLLRLAQDLDVGTVHSSTVDIALFVIRLACRVENYLSFAVERLDDPHRSVMRERELSGDSLRLCQSALSLLRRELRGSVHRMLEQWCDEAMREIDHSVEAAVRRSDDAKMDANTRLACSLHAHLVLLYRNAQLQSLDENIASQLLASFVFLTTRHTFNLQLLSVDESDVWEALSALRRPLVAFLRSCSQSALNAVCESAVRVSTGTGVRRLADGASSLSRQWGYVAGPRNVARFAVVSNWRRQQQPGGGAVQTIAAAEQTGVELDLGLAQLTLRSSHLKALEAAIAGNEDVLEVFGPASMQAATLQSAEHREWVRLVGRSCDLQWWKTPDARAEPQSFDREYAPGELEDSEQWIVPILEPVRLQYLTRPFVLQLVLPEQPLQRDAEVAVLMGLHPKRGGNWKAVYVLRHLRVVHVYNVYSHGRRFYMSLEYTSDVRFTLRSMQPSVKDRQHAWPAWERHGAGHPYAEHGDPLSVVILRQTDVSDNRSGSEETFIPARLLYGLLPAALLDSHRFWQDSRDVLRGYPKDEAATPYLLIVSLQQHRDVAPLRTAGVVARVSRIPLTALDGQRELQSQPQRRQEEEKSKEEAESASPAETERPVSEEELELLDVLYAPSSSNLGSLALTIARVENLSHVLAWSRASRRLRSAASSASEPEAVVDLLELPRLKLNFACRADDDGELRLYSLDHTTLFVSNERSALTSRLISGLPHSLLLSNANGEVVILVPSLHPVRPAIGTAPFSTELVMHRDDKDWTAAVQDNRYHLYPVHVSLSFMFTPTLSSALYLLLLRFLHRDYAEVFRLSQSVGTDVELSAEEAVIFSALGDIADAHPDAHACRLRLSVVTADSPLRPGWELTHEMSRYVTKLSHVSAVCRLGHAEEQQLAAACILSLQDPRFDPDTMREYDIVLVANRAAFLSALLASQPSCAVSTPERAVGGRWTAHTDPSFLAATPLDWQQLSLQFSASPQLSGVMSLDVAHQLWSGVESVNGAALKLGFLFFYSLFTGSIKMKVSTEDESATFASLLLQLMMDAHDPGLLQSVLHTLARNPAICASLPKYRDSRQYKHETVHGWSDDSSPSPIDELFTELIPSLQSLAPLLLQPPASHPHPAPPSPRCDVRQPAGREWVIPSLTDFACDQRELRPVDGAALGDDSLTLTADDVAVLVSQPLSALPLASYVTYQSRAERGLPAVSEQLPYPDVSRHPQAQSEVARQMTQRLQADMQIFAAQENGGQSVALLTLLDEQVRDIVAVPSSPSLSAAQQQVSGLLSSLQQLRDSDSAYVSTAIPWLLSQANTVTMDAAVPGEEEAETVDRFRFLLRRYAGQESHLWLETVFASLLSSCSAADLQRVNPYLQTAQLQAIVDVAVAVILRANRVGQANRAISDARDLLALLLQAQDQHPQPAAKPLSASVSGLAAGLRQKSEMLARQLVTGRHYVSSAAADARLLYDPRFLVFEFTWNICLRQQQISMVTEFMDAVRQGRSLVKGMLMGEGKTTVVGPLLALMLADGRRLVIQVQPPALLDFSRSIQRSTFSSIMYKRIWTVSMERSSRVDHRLHAKLETARLTGGIVVSTPTAIKSIQLKYVELLGLLNDSSRPPQPGMEAEARELLRCLLLFRHSLLVMDEVDLILHPLKSELNFPIGAREELDHAPHRWRLPIHLIDSIFYADRGGRMAVGFKDSSRAHSILTALAAVLESGYAVRALQRIPHLVLLNTGWYHQHMKPLMLDWLLLWLEAQHLSGLSEEAMRRYVLQGSHGDAALTAEVEALPGQYRKMLNLSHDWLHSYLPHLLSKIDRVSFGLLNAADLQRARALDPFMANSRAVLAVPFVGKDVPARAAEFAHPDVIIGLTVLAYRYEGLRETDFHDIIASLRSTLTKEIGPYARRQSSRRYNRWVREAGGRIRGQQQWRDEQQHGDDAQQAGSSSGSSSAIKSSSAMPEEDRVEVVALRLLKRSNSEQMSRLYQLLRLLPELIHWYLLEQIFPAEMRHQEVKLQASGQDLGGDMLFPVRLAFSGTPSSLLPYELGSAHFQPGSDGLILNTLTDPAVVSCARVAEGWSVHSLLDAIACNPHVHALIDTGALITGMSNEEVARFLLRRGLPGCAGVVFLDSLDRKMILVRSTGHVVPLAASGIPAEHRFAFYDQIHTTGMDIAHRLNAVAVLTLGKDMTFRDYAQGAYRMRGIGRGQRISLCLIPEIADLMRRELQAAGCKREAELADERATLQAVCGWLVINSMASERVQFNALCLQNLANVWRKTGFRCLLEQVDAASIGQRFTAEQRQLKDSLALFHEPVDFSVESGVKQPRLFSASVDALISAHSAFIRSSADEKVVQRVQAAVRGVVDDDCQPLFDREMVQEQQQEKERQQEAEQEEELEVERFADYAYSRENEAATPWPFASLAVQGEIGEQLPLPFLYPLRSFHLRKRQPLLFPSPLQLTSNYFNPQWSGARRIKNVVMVLELCPSPQQLRLMQRSSAPQLTAKQQLALKTAISLFRRSGSSDGDGLQQEEVAALIRAAMDLSPTEQQVADEMQRLSGGRPLDSAGVVALLQSAELRPEESGRFFICLSLAEAETVRRILHLRLEQPVIADSQTAIALRFLPGELSIIDRSSGLLPAPSYQAAVAQHCLNFFDSSLHYADSGINVLLRALDGTSCRQRQLFFTRVIGCRRRMARRWEETPLARLFTVPDQYHMLKQRAQSMRVRAEIEARGLQLYDFFRAADADRNGLLAAAELWGALDWLRIPMAADDVVHLLATFDTDGDRNLSYHELVAMLRDPNSSPEDDDAAEVEDGAARGVQQQQQQLQRIPPKGAAEIAAVMQELRQEEKAVEEEELRAEREEEDKVKQELKAEEEEEDRQQEGGPNPQVEPDRIRFDFTTGRRPRLLAVSGDVAYRQDGAGRRQALKLFKGSSLRLTTPLAVGRTARPSSSAAGFTLTLELRADSLPSGVSSLLVLNGGRLLLRSDGCIGYDSAFNTEKSGPRLRKDSWAVLSVAVSSEAADGALQVHIDGRLCCALRHADCRLGGPMALPEQLTIAEAAAGDAAVDVSLRSAIIHLQALAAADVQALYEAMLAESAWACAVCTTINMGNSSRCAVCGSARQSEVGQAAGDEWECQACTSRNPNTAAACTVCETPRGA